MTARSVLVLLALAAPAIAHALASDREQPVKVSADKIEVNQKTGRSTYTGNVVLVQGTLRIEANEVIVHLRNGALDKVFAKGKPVTFRQRLDGEAEEIFGAALRVQYYALENRVDLFDRVTFRQGTDTFQSPVVHYDITTTRLTADASAQERVHGVIQPRKSGPEGNKGAPAGQAGSKAR